MQTNSGTWSDSEFRPATASRTDRMNNWLEIALLWAAVFVVIGCWR